MLEPFLTAEQYLALSIRCKENTERVLASRSVLKLTNLLHLSKYLVSDGFGLESRTYEIHCRVCG